MSNKRCKVESTKYEVKIGPETIYTSGYPKLDVPYVGYINGDYLVQVIFSADENIFDDWRGNRCVVSACRRRGYLNLKQEDIDIVDHDFCTLDHVYHEPYRRVKLTALTYRLIEDISMTMDKQNHYLSDTRSLLSLYVPEYVDQIVVDYVSCWIVRSMESLRKRTFAQLLMS